MARFPYRPGAGAKAIKNPIYWNRLHLQESAGRRSRSKYTEAAHLTARWLNINANLNYFLCGWYKPVLDIEHRLTGKEAEKLAEALDVVVDFRDTIDSSCDYMSQANFNKYVTRIKRFFLLVFKLTVKYEVCPEGEPSLLDYCYDPDEKEFVVVYGDWSSHRRYFMGRPNVRQLDEIRRLYRQSQEAVEDDFRQKDPVPKKKPAVRKKTVRKRKSSPSKASRAKGVVEQICDSGVIKFKYGDCVQREATVRSRIKLHLRVAFQPHAREGEIANVSEMIDTMISNVLELNESDSVQFPIKHGSKILVVFEFER